MDFLPKQNSHNKSIVYSPFSVICTKAEPAEFKKSPQETLKFKSKAQNSAKAKHQRKLFKTLFKHLVDYAILFCLARTHKEVPVRVFGDFGELLPRVFC